MQTLPQHPRRRPVDPQLPKGRKKLGSTFVVSALAIGVVFFAKGDLPQIDNAFVNLNAIIQSHNDEAVRAILHYGPIALVAVGVAGLALMVRSSIQSRRSA